MTREPNGSYAAAGVDIEAGEALVERIKPFAKATARAGASAALGGFGGLFDLKEAGFRDPILVASNDGYRSFYQSTGGWIVVSIGVLMALGGWKLITALGRVPIEPRVLVEPGARR